MRKFHVLILLAVVFAFVVIAGVWLLFQSGGGWFFWFLTACAVIVALSLLGVWLDKKQKTSKRPMGEAEAAHMVTHHHMLNDR